MPDAGPRPVAFTDSGVWAGSSASDVQRFCIATPPTKLQTYSAKLPNSRWASRTLAAFTIVDLPAQAHRLTGPPLRRDRDPPRARVLGARQPAAQDVESVPR